MQTILGGGCVCRCRRLPRFVWMCWTCTSVAILWCIVSNDGKLQFALAKQESAVWNQGGLGGSPFISYSLGAKKVTLKLACPAEGESANFEAQGESPINSYTFLLTHPCVCWDGCKGELVEWSSHQFSTMFSVDTPTTKKPKPAGGAVSGGTVFIIILLVLAVVYFIGFAAYYRFRLQRSGVDLIAHRTFWVALPSYVKDGATYTFRRATGKPAGSYQSVWNPHSIRPERFPDRVWVFGPFTRFVNTVCVCRNLSR